MSFEMPSKLGKKHRAIRQNFATYHTVWTPISKFIKKDFYRQLDGNQPSITQPPPSKEVEEFWESVWTNEDVHELCEKQIACLQQYFAEKSSDLHVAIRHADNNYTPLNLVQGCVAEVPSQAAYVQQRRFYQIKQVVNAGDILAETEVFMLAIQDQVLNTKDYLKYKVKSNIDNDLCRRCHQQSETT
ncbi:hypothetical protein ILUMI_12556 [Ignelater luminosus]|uniref:Uncharacterized protein n=1 Tax=Ignelater luminosus TaxID=2038154 RepID=A0A8K0D048_IGNLU|nr:hypothetical protein ILUMI_12556 [Ignelater luminosus]